MKKQLGIRFTITSGKSIKVKELAKILKESFSPVVAPKSHTKEKKNYASRKNKNK